MNAINAARRARKLSVEELSARTRISLRYIEAIDEGRLAELPGGIYGRAYVRAVADLLGVEGEELQGLLSALCPAPDPLPVLEEVHAPRRPSLAIPADLRIYVAACVDAAVLLGISVAVVFTVSAACGLAAGELVHMALAPLAVLCVGIWVLYFVLLGGVNGCTLGQLACGLALTDAKPLRLGEIARRALGMDHGASAPDYRGGIFATAVRIWEPPSRSVHAKTSSSPLSARRG
jgi:transcriptional regulator with XRE-family HTH domain